MQTSKDLKDLDVQFKKISISAEKFGRGTFTGSSKNLSSIHKNISSLAGHTRKLVGRVSEIEKKSNINSKKITSLKTTSKTQSGRISGADIGSKLPGGSGKNVEENISTISKSVDSIAKILLGRKKLSAKQAESERRKKEKEKRALAESKLEKAFQGIANTAQKIIQPVKSILDRILEFIGTIIFGRILVKIIRWFGNPQNREKLNSVIRFFKDWAPQLLSLYIVFGTSLGRFARGLVGLLIKSTIKIGALATKLAVKAGIGRVGGKLSKVSKFLGGKKGQLLGAGLETLFAVGSTVAIGNALKGDGGGGEAGQTKIQNFNGGGYVKPRFPSFSGGGFNFKGMMGGASMGAMFGPLGMLLGGGKSNGFVSGEKGVDKVPAMLSDGEFVMSRGAVDKYGVGTLEAMNAAGGGTNVPKIVSGTTYAAGGGYIGDARKALIDIGNYFSSQGINLQDPRTWGGGGGFRMPNISGIKIPREFGGGTLGGLGNQITQSASGVQTYIQDTFKKLKSDPRVQDISKAVGDIQKKLVKSGYLNEDGQLSGAAKNQATNFLSDLLPNLPFVNSLNKMKTESYLKSIGISKENAKYGDLAAQAMITGKSGIESAYNIGEMQLNKMSKESKKVYMDILKQKMSAGTLKSGDVINPYAKVDKTDPRYREQGSVRFYVDPKTGKGYLLDTYGFDPGKVDLGGPGSDAQRQYEKQVASFQDENKKLKLGPLDIPLGQIAKKLDLRPMQDATEGGGLPQYILALRNKLFGYDAAKEGGGLDPKRFKSKAQIDELSELGDLKKFAAQLSPTQKRLVDEKLKQEKTEQERKKQAEIKNQKALEAKRPWWDKAGWFGGASAEMKRQAENQQPAQIKKDPPKVPSITPSPKPKPKVTVVKSSSKRSRYSQGANAAPKTPNFGATSPASTANRKQRQKLFGIF
jgi:hypothetical protein|tara:strand:+ start:5587 stop:8352 length:2766 start_codon:yes stop_codon:yes gene_type:complete